MGQDTTRTIQVDTLARVEGEGALDIRIRQGRVDSSKPCYGVEISPRRRT